MNSEYVEKEESSDFILWKKLMIEKEDLLLFLEDRISKNNMCRAGIRNVMIYKNNWEFCLEAY